MLDGEVVHLVRNMMDKYHYFRRAGGNR